MVLWLKEKDKMLIYPCPWCYRSRAQQIAEGHAADCRSAGPAIERWRTLSREWHERRIAAEGDSDVTAGSLTEEIQLLHGENAAKHIQLNYQVVEDIIEEGGIGCEANWWQKVVIYCWTTPRLWLVDLWYDRGYWWRRYLELFGWK